MPTAKVAITLDRKLLERIDELVSQQRFPSRSRAVQVALEEQVVRWERGRLARECAKLDPKEEQSMAEEGLAGDTAQWPEY
jgi:metal-responsive CopG/Arc/MetJ family transcriptional regulator